jgi:hypothetical protein
VWSITIIFVKHNWLAASRGMHDHWSCRNMQFQSRPVPNVENVKHIAFHVSSWQSLRNIVLIENVWGSYHPLRAELCTYFPGLRLHIPSQTWNSSLLQNWLKSGYLLFVCAMVTLLNGVHCLWDTSAWLTPFNIYSVFFWSDNCAYQLWNLLFFTSTIVW